MKEVAIKKICDILENKYGVELNKKTALDFFARSGDWQTKYYAKKVKQIYAWEIDKRFENELKINLPENAVTEIGDSFLLSKKFENLNFFDFIVIDNPQGCYGKEESLCEHFEALPLCLKLLNQEDGLIVFNIKTKPFNYDDKAKWQMRRNIFYEKEDCSKLSKKFILNFYKNYFKKHKFDCEYMFLEKRPQESGLYALVAKVKKINEYN